jgi:hypothetical protein
MPELSKPEDFDQSQTPSSNPMDEQKPEFTLKFLPLAIGTGILGAIIGVVLYAVLGFYFDFFITVTFLLVGALIGLGVCRI